MAGCTLGQRAARGLEPAAALPAVCTLWFGKDALPAGCQASRRPLVSEDPGRRLLRLCPRAGAGICSAHRGLGGKENACRPTAATTRAP